MYRKTLEELEMALKKGQSRLQIISGEVLQMMNTQVVLNRLDEATLLAFSNFHGLVMRLDAAIEAEDPKSQFHYLKTYLDQNTIRAEILTSLSEWIAWAQDKEGVS